MSNMHSDNDFALARLIADKLEGRFWQITLGEWWVVVEGVTAQRLVIWTNDPFGVTFTPDKLSMGLQGLKDKVIGFLIEDGIISEDGAWAFAA